MQIQLKKFFVLPEYILVTRICSDRNFKAFGVYLFLYPLSPPTHLFPRPYLYILFCAAKSTFVLAIICGKTSGLTANNVYNYCYLKVNYYQTAILEKNESKFYVIFILNSFFFDRAVPLVSFKVEYK